MESIRQRFDDARVETLTDVACLRALLARATPPRLAIINGASRLEPDLARAMVERGIGMIVLGEPTVDDTSDYSGMVVVPFPFTSDMLDRALDRFSAA